MASASGSGAENTPDWSFLTPEIFDPSSTTLDATGLSKEQYHLLSLVWIEVRRWVIALSSCTARELDVDVGERDEFLSNEPRVGEISPEKVPQDYIPWNAFPHRERIPYSELANGHNFPTRWDHLKTTITVKIPDNRGGGTEKREGEGEIGFWVRWTSAANNIYLSRLWEMNFGGLKYDVPLRTVHKYYMLQFELNEKKPIIMKGNKSKKQKAQKQTPFFTEPYQVQGDSSLREKYTVHIPLASKRFPQWLTPSIFWGMLQLYWYRNIRSLLNFHQKLPDTQLYDLGLIMDRISVYFDSYCRASGFLCRENNFINFTPQERSTFGNLSQGSRKPDSKPRDQFQWWKEYIFCTPDVEMHDFDFMFAQFLSDEHQLLRDQQYAMQFHARAAYLTRVWGHDTHDVLLKNSLESIATMAFDLPAGFEFSLNNDIFDKKKLVIDGLKEYLADDTAARYLLGEACKEFQRGTENYGKASGEQLTQARGQLRYTYAAFAFMFAALDRLRGTVVQFIDEADDLLVQDEMEEWDGGGQKVFAPEERARFWLDVATQYGYVSLNETKVGSEPPDKWREHQTKLNMITTKDQKVILSNQQINRDRMKLHLPQRARRHTIEYKENKTIDYAKPVRDYADPIFEYQGKWNAPEAALKYWDNRVEDMRLLLRTNELSDEGSVGELRDRLLSNKLSLDGDSETPPTEAPAGAPAGA